MDAAERPGNSLWDKTLAAGRGCGPRLLLGACSDVGELDSEGRNTQASPQQRRTVTPLAEPVRMRAYVCPGGGGGNGNSSRRPGRFSPPLRGRVRSRRSRRSRVLVAAESSIRMAPRFLAGAASSVDSVRMKHVLPEPDVSINSCQLSASATASVDGEQQEGQRWSSRLRHSAKCVNTWSEPSHAEEQVRQ